MRLLFCLRFNVFDVCGDTAALSCGVVSHLVEVPV